MLFSQAARWVGLVAVGGSVLAIAIALREHDPVLLIWAASAAISGVIVGVLGEIGLAVGVVAAILERNDGE